MAYALIIMALTHRVNPRGDGGRLQKRKVIMSMSQKPNLPFFELSTMITAYAMENYVLQ